MVEQMVKDGEGVEDRQRVGEDVREAWEEEVGYKLAVTVSVKK